MLPVPVIGTQVKRHLCGNPEKNRESVLRVDGDGGQGKGHRLGTELGEERRNEKEIGKRAGERDR